MTRKIKLPQSNWEKEFEEMFYEKDAHPSEPDIIHRAHGEEIKDFIRQLLVQEKQKSLAEKIKEIEGLKKDHKEGDLSDYGNDEYNRGRKAGFLYACDDILSTLKEKRKLKS